ncbi:MAG: polyphosphate kinase 1 [Planctomycetaceae bacterium]|nr:polyphosphate kinase 1 [Planctomycetaceae bacterium]
MTAETARYLNRELSWLEFNQRVLDEARDPGIPLLERLKFLAITSSNLDEFFMVRVGGLQLLAERDQDRRDPSGLTAAEQLDRISSRTHRMVQDQYACLLEELEPALAEAGLRRNTHASITDRQLAVLEQLFDEEIFALLTPQAVTGPEDFPLLPNRRLNLCVELAPAPRTSKTTESAGTPRFAILPVGPAVQRFITLPSDGGYDYILVEDVVRMFVERFFPGEEIIACEPFRMTRNADMSIREDQALDLLRGMQQILDARKQSDCVRLELAATASPGLRQFLKQAVELSSDQDIYDIPGPLDLSSFMQQTDLAGFDALRYEAWPPQDSTDVDPSRSMFDTIADHDVLLSHPSESFEPVIRFVEEAADDPDVMAIRQTLYRTSRNSPVVAALRRAAGNGKSVTAIVELKARFDEARNIEWARDLEKEGVQVIYGVRGLKTHAKICLVVRREASGIRRYMHFGTGNYNEATARLYSDISYFTCDEELGADAVSFFNSITGYSQPQRYARLEAAPIGLRDKLLELISSETKRRQQGQSARIVAKFNSLVDTKLIDALYEASQAGVTVQLNIRGICCLRPGVPGLSENITVVSIIDRCLEHSRIVYFHQGGAQRVFISSADWMPRNLDRRVELLVPVDAPECRSRLIHLLRACFRDNVKARHLLPDGGYRLARPDDPASAYRCQEMLYEEACERARSAEQSRRTVFEPHQAPGTEE